MSATRRLLARDGYDQLSIASVAEEAGVSRPTVYRRWPSKAHLVFDALFDAVAGDDPLSSSGDFDADLRRFVRAMFEWRRQPAMEGAGRDLLMALQRDLEGETGVEQLLSEQTLRTALQALVRDGVEQGVVSADVNAEMLFDTLVGTSVYLVHARRVDNLEHAADQLCSLLVQGVASRT